MFVSLYVFVLFVCVHVCMCACVHACETLDMEETEEEVSKRRDLVKEGHLTGGSRKLCGGKQTLKLGGAS